MFSPATVEAIGSYVYALADEDDRVFYVGKGEGNRVFAHIEDVRRLLRVDPENPLLKTDGTENADFDSLDPKRQRIAQMLRRGVEPRMYIVREGLSPEQALLLEAALISVLDWQSGGSLTNQVAGHGTSRFGLTTVEDLEATKGEPFRLRDLPDLYGAEEIIAINVNRRWNEVVIGSRTLLEISAGDWPVSRPRAQRCRYAVIHVTGIVRGVFRIDRWERSDRPGRFRFIAVGGQPLDGDAFSNKNASSLFGAGGSGTQNPIRYVLLSE